MSGPGDKVAILSANDPVAFACVFGISRAGAVWCPINPRNEAAENRELLDLFDCSVLLYQEPFAPVVERIRADLPRCTPGSASTATSTAVRRAADGSLAWRPSSTAAATPASYVDQPAVDDVAMIVGTGGTTGRPKGVVLTGTNLETMTALTLMGYPFEGRPVYLALAPLTHAAGVLCFPILCLGGEVVIMRAPDVGGFLELVPAPPGDAHLPAADADLHGARPRGARRHGPLVVAVLLVRRGADVGRRGSRRR